MADDNVAAVADNEGPAPAPVRTGWDTLKSILFQVVIFYFISSYFRGGKSPPSPTNQDGSPSLVGRNLFEKDDKLV